MAKATVVVQTNFTFFDDNETLYFPGEARQVEVTELVDKYIFLGMLRLVEEAEVAPEPEVTEPAVAEPKQETKKPTNVNKTTKGQTTDPETQENVNG